MKKICHFRYVILERHISLTTPERLIGNNFRTVYFWAVIVLNKKYFREIIKVSSNICIISSKYTKIC